MQKFVVIWLPLSYTRAPPIFCLLRDKLGIYKFLTYLMPQPRFIERWDGVLRYKRPMQANAVNGIAIEAYLPKRRVNCKVVWNNSTLCWYYKYRVYVADETLIIAASYHETNTTHRGYSGRLLTHIHFNTTMDILVRNKFKMDKAKLIALKNKCNDSLLKMGFKEARLKMYCGYCNKQHITNQTPFKVCSGCRCIRYCSRRCQKKDWCNGHRTLCMIGVLHTYKNRRMTHISALSC